MKYKPHLIYAAKIICVSILLVVTCSCGSAKMTEYYSNKENYINAVGTVSYIKYNEDSTVLYVGFSELSPTFDDTCFKLVSDNLKIAQSNNIDGMLCVGKQITFMTAPKYFGDGYVMPIVAISIDGEVILSFDQGYENLINWLSK